MGAHDYRLLDFVALSGTGMPVLQTCPKESFGSRSERRRARLNSRRFSNKVSVEKSESCDSVSVSSGRRRGQLNSRRFSTIPSEQNCRDQYRSLHTFQSFQGANRASSAGPAINSDYKRFHIRRFAICLLSCSCHMFHGCLRLDISMKLSRLMLVQ